MGKYYYLEQKDDYEELYPRATALLESSIWGKHRAVMEILEIALESCPVPINTKKDLDVVCCVLRANSFPGSVTGSRTRVKKKATVQAELERTIEPKHKTKAVKPKSGPKPIPVKEVVKEPDPVPIISGQMPVTEEETVSESKEYNPFSWESLSEIDY